MSLWPSMCILKASLNISEFSCTFLYLPLSRMLLKPSWKRSALKVVLLESLVAVHSDSRMVKQEKYISALMSPSFLRPFRTSLPVSIPKDGSMKVVSRRIFNVGCLLFNAYRLYLLGGYGCEFLAREG